MLKGIYFDIIIMAYTWCPTITAEKYMLVTPYMIMKILASDRWLKQ